MARTKFGAAVKWGLLGAAATWFLDPQQGPERRQQVQDKLLGVARQKKDELQERFGDTSAPVPVVDLDAAEEVQQEPTAPGGPSLGTAPGGSSTPM